MYKNIGKKLKGFSYCFAWIIIAICSFYAFYRGFLNGFSIKNLLVGVAIVFDGCLVAIVLSWFVYAFGELVQKTAEQNENLEILIEKIDDLPKKFNNQSTQKSKSEVYLSEFKTNQSKTDVLNSQLRRLKNDYEMSRITYDEYEARKKKLEAEYK